MDLFFQSFKNYFKKKSIQNNSKIRKNNGTRKEDFSTGKGKNGGKGPSSGPKCSECHGYGHLAHECVNVLKRKTNFKANITWDDSDSDKSEEEHKDKTNLIAFGASLHSCSSDHESSDDSEDGKTDEDEGIHELKEKYNQLYEESVKIAETNLKLVEKYKKSNLELATMSIQVEELQGYLNTVTIERDQLRKDVGILKEKNKILSDENILLVSKINDLQVELTSANVLFERLNTGSKKLDGLLDIQRSTNDRSGLGFHGASSSKQLGGKVYEVKPKKVLFKSNVINIASNNGKKPNIFKKANVAKFVPTCHHCNVKGHIRPNCFKLHGYPSIGFESFDHANCNNISHIKTSSKRANVQKIWTNYARYENVGNTTFKDMKPQPMANQQSQVVPIKTRSIWVRKSGLRPYTNLSITTLDDSGPSREVDLAF
ncbi:hypothetical protein RHGRI_022512 [Rhododendron griersonianum]|uniref:CCHC-type domain-containing protein n=1 Tax=Rhododendron griersonianum TaxID=479676 RepID=A0AAV6J1W0_9ERIC|nr:hypothetical protein RHGRI_022512 [Rhododendron griersonianum]